MEIAAYAATASPRTAVELRAERAATDFEAMMLAELLRPMFEATVAPGLAGGGSGEAALAALLHEQYARIIAESGGVGVAPSVMAALIGLQSAPASGGKP
jgi:Rod binding domain-containing protein